MDQGMLGKVVALRDEAFATLKALDDAVVSLGGPSSLAAGAPRANGATSTALEGVRRGAAQLSQSGAAEIILRERGEPVTGADLMTALPSKGVMIGGKNRRINFTSAMSKSGRFRSVRRDGTYYWWFKNEPLPSEWQEAPDLLGKDGSGASAVGTNQEGGEANATANLTSP